MAATSAAEPGAEVTQGLDDSFKNESAMMIAYERSLEARRGDEALFSDPFAAVLAGPRGETLSDTFGAGCDHFGLVGWADFHRTWTAVRTRFIDDQIAHHAGSGKLCQLVNLGAGMDTRAYRLESCGLLEAGCFEVDMAVVNDEKRTIFEKVLENPTAKCNVKTIDLDFLSEDQSLKGELEATQGFCAEKPSLFLAEGLIQYLGPQGKLKLIRDVSAVAVPGSVWVLQFLDPSGGPAAGAEFALTTDEARAVLMENGWEQLQFWKFGEEGLNFGRFPLDRFEPCAAFSFVVCVKA